MGADTGHARTSGWEPGEEVRYRKREVNVHAASLGFSVLIVVATIWAASSAAKAAQAAAEAVSVAQDAIERSANEARYAAGVAAVGGELGVERVAGFTMLRRNVEDRVADVNADPERDEAHRRAQRDAIALFQVTLDVYENYLRYPPETVEESASAALPGAETVPAEAEASYAEERFGAPDRSPDQVYAAAHLRGFLSEDNGAALRALDDDVEVNVDLATAPLYGQSWRGIDLAWLDSVFLTGIDLRGATLAESDWGSATLVSAHLQCANLDGARLNEPDPGGGNGTSDLAGANLRAARLVHANLQGADLRGVDLSGADLTGAHVEGALLDGAVLDGAVTEGVVGHPASGPDIGTVDASTAPDFEIGRCLDEGHALE